MVRLRRGAGSLGCLMSLLIVSVIIYFGVNIAEAYWREYQFQDEMNQQVLFAAHNRNDQIVRHLQAVADSLDLPDDAHDIDVKRTGRDISIGADYSERVELPLTVREIHFHPHAEGTF